MDETIDILHQRGAAPSSTTGVSCSTSAGSRSRPRPFAVPLILGGNTERALRRAEPRLGDGWFSSGTPSFDDALRLRDRVLQLRSEGDGGEFPVYVRIADAEQETLARYEAAGFEHVLVWADQLWPADGDPTAKREAFAGRVRDLRLARPVATVG